MKINYWISLALAVLSLAASPLAQAQGQSPGRKGLVITKIVATDALAKRMSKQGVTLSLDSVLQALDSQVYDRMVNTRRFNVFDRSDSDALLQEAGATGSKFVFSKADYVLTIRIDSFNDRQETRRFAKLNTTVTARVVEASAVAKVTVGSTGLAVGTANVQVAVRDGEERSNNTTNQVGEANDDLINQATRELAQKLTARAIDFIYPARVLARRDKIVTINRNDTSGIEVGQVWEVFALGNELVDPDTGDKTREELLVGTVKVTRVTPQNSQAEIVTDTGIAESAVLRMVATPTP
jgi:curli biogenesis system outer membrane secretion channel CsgG